MTRIKAEARSRRISPTPAGWLVIYTLLVFMTGVLIWVAIGRNEPQNPLNPPAVGLLGPQGPLDRPGLNVVDCEGTGKRSKIYLRTRPLCRCGGSAYLRRTT